MINAFVYQQDQLHVKNKQTTTKPSLNFMAGRLEHLSNCVLQL